LLLPLSGTLLAQPAESSEKQLYRFGLDLFRLGDYYRAITELKRFTLLFPQHRQHNAAQVLIGLALQEDAMYDEAFAHFQRFQQHTDDGEARRIATFKLGEIRFLQRQYGEATEHFRGFLGAFHDGPLVTQTAYMLGLSATLADDAEQGQNAWSLLPPDDPLARQAAEIEESLRLAPPLRRKSPLLAGVLSGILPGAGHLYAGKPLQALTAFLLNGLFLTGAAYAFHEGFEATAIILLYFETGWYLGTINSATTVARQFNLQQQQQRLSALHDTYALPVLSLPALQTPGLGLRFTF
jgi:tetratricopeptide (TPR) repeat protein